MQVQRFLDHLPALYEGWGTPSVRPRAGQFAEVLARVQGMTSPAVLQLLNAAVGCLEGDEVYAEVGCFQGATLIGALLDHPGRSACAADNFSGFDRDGSNRQMLRHNLAAFGLLERVQFFEQDYEEFLPALYGRDVRFGVYFYDGLHDNRSQLLNLLLAAPLLAERALIVLDDSNALGVKQATYDFLAVRPEAQMLLDLPTPGNGHASFWNGLMVLGWDGKCVQGTERDTLRQGRQAALLESLRVLQHVNITVQGPTVCLTFVD
jgi:predicted O-methyltransferase YrrM